MMDWDLWPGRVAYESPAGQVQRLNRAFRAMGAAIRSFGVSVEQASEGMQRMSDALAKRHIAAKR